MKIKLISPRMSLRPMDSEYKRLLSPSISLLILAGLTPDEHEVYIEDENAGEINFDDNPDLVGITVNVDTSKRAYEISRRYREKKIPVVLGGIHPSACPDEAGRHADTICIGEAEQVWGKIIEDAQDGKLNKMYYCEKPANLSSTPIPKWALLDTSRYLYTCIVCASRSCPFSCEFCYNSCRYVHHQYRNRPVENVVEEIHKLGTRQVMFIDDNFIGNPDWTREFVKAIKPLNLTWHAAVSTTIGQHLDLLDQMQASGCKSLFIGFETLNGDSISSVNKKQNKVETYDRLIDEIHSRRIMINASLAFGFDHDKPDVFKQTLDWLVANRIETMTGHILTPYPGTVLYERLHSEGRIIDYDYTHYNTAHVVFKPAQMTSQQLYEGYLWIYDRFYSLENILKRMPLDRRQRIPYFLFNFGYRKFGKITSRVAEFGLMNWFGRLARRLAYGID
ncbi:MAG: radical SAM protein [Candidatus Zixiibacteriota bacterium]